MIIIIFICFYIFHTSPPTGWSSAARDLSHTHLCTNWATEVWAMTLKVEAKSPSQGRGEMSTWLHQQTPVAMEQAGPFGPSLLVSGCCGASGVSKPESPLTDMFMWVDTRAKEPLALPSGKGCIWHTFLGHLLWETGTHPSLNPVLTELEGRERHPRGGCCKFEASTLQGVYFLKVPALEDCNLPTPPPTTAPHHA